MLFRLDFVLTIISIIAGVVTIVWFIRDVRKENSKILKAILDIQNKSLDVQKTSIEILKAQTDVLVKIEDGQRKGFETLANIQREGFETLANILNKVSEMLLNQTKILERINGKLPPR